MSILQPHSKKYLPADQTRLSRQRGAILVLTTIGMFALLMVTGLALDGGHLLLNKTRLQNTVDASALNAAKVLTATNDIVAADQAARSAFTTNADGSGNSELAEGLNNGEIVLSVQFSSTLNPFASGSSPANFVRVIARNFRFDTILVHLGGMNEGVVSASAVAGPSPSLNAEICDYVPMMLCGDEDTDPNDDMFFGYPKNTALVAKHGANQDSDVGAGNFQLIRMPEGQGGDVVRRAMAGEFDPSECLSAGDPVETEPGNTVGPVVQGLNTRFGQYQGPVNSTEHPADWETTIPDTPLELDGDGNIVYPGPANDYSDLSFHHDDYASAYSSNPSWCNDEDPGHCHRRIMAVPIGNCNGTTNGQGQVQTWGSACIYLIQPVVQQGIEAHVFVQLVALPSKIVLYKDPSSTDS
jgi:Flp pilus assembly protein TadG